MTAQTFAHTIFVAPSRALHAGLPHKVVLVARRTQFRAYTLLQEEGPVQESAKKIFEEPEVATVEKLESGREVKVLNPSLRPEVRRTIDDLSKDLLKRLVENYITEKSRVKLGRRGVTRQVGDDILRRWGTKECVKVHADHKSVKGNMKVTGQQLAQMTGGIVIWMSGSKLLLYRDDEGQKMREELIKSMEPPKMPYDPYDSDEEDVPP